MLCHGNHLSHETAAKLQEDKVYPMCNEPNLTTMVHEAFFYVTEVTEPVIVLQHLTVMLMIHLQMLMIHLQ